MINVPNLDVSGVGDPFFREDTFPLEWQMSRNEKYCLISLLEKIHPNVVIEIGTHKGGSLQVLSKYANKVYSVDRNPNVKIELEHKFSNVEFLSGDSNLLLPELLGKDEVRSRLGFILIDGDHSTNGVKNDINNVLSTVPKNPLYVLLHDSFNPECRKGIKSANYQKCKYVHFVEIDFVSGVFNPNKLYREMWGGLSLIVMLPEERNNNITVFESQKKQFTLTYFHSIHLIKDRLVFLKRILKKIIHR